MKCCSQCQGIERMFDDGVAAEELAEYQKRGPARTTRILLDALRQAGVEGLTLLDIGGGVGAIQHEMIRAGASHVTHVDASSAYLNTARREAERLGHADRVQYQHGDFVTLAPQIEAADVVTLDRVICCYPDMPALVGLSSAHARRYYAAVFPRDFWGYRLGVRLANLFLRLQRNPFRMFVHRTQAIDAILQSNGFRRQVHRKTLVWQIVVYDRAG